MELQEVLSNPETNVDPEEVEKQSSTSEQNVAEQATPSMTDQMELEEEMPNPQTNVDPVDEDEKSTSCEQIEQNLTEEQAQPSLTDQEIRNPRLATPEAENEDKGSQSTKHDLD